MKTVFITAYHAFVSRALFHGSMLKKLSEQGDIHIVILAPPAKQEFLQKLYGGPHIEVRGVDVQDEVASPYNKFWYRLGFLLENTRYVKDQRRERLWNNRGIFGYINYALVSAVSLILRHIPGIKNLYRFLDYHCARWSVDEKFFSRGVPNLVFAADAFGESDVLVLRAARRRGIRTMSMVRSWDNTTTKGILRFFADHMIVNSIVTQEELTRIHGYPKDTISIVGLPQFDAWVSGPTLSREEFMASIGADPSKRLLLFAPAGAALSDVDWQLCSILQKALDDGRLPNTIHVLIRNHPAHPADLSRFQGDTRFTIEVPGSRVIEGDLKATELTPSDDAHLRNSIFYSDIIMYIATSLGLDASVYNKPQIIVSFDGFEKKPYVRSVERHNQEDCLGNIVRRGGTKVARSEAEWIAAIQEYLQDPSRDNEGRQRAIRDFLYSSDGRAGDRIAEAIMKFI